MEWRYHHGPTGNGDDHRIWHKDVTRKGYKPSKKILMSAAKHGIIGMPGDMCPKCGAPMGAIERIISNVLVDEEMCIECMDKINGDDGNGRTGESEKEDC